MTQERLLINKYSKLLNEVTAENKVLTELLVKEKEKSAMFFENSRKYKHQLSELQNRVNKFKEQLW